MATLPENASQLFDVPITNGLIPPEGPKALAVTAPFDGTVTSFTLNLLLTQSQQFMSGVQAVFVDNADNASSVTVHNQTLNQSVTIPANSQGYVPLLVAKNDVVTVSSDGTVPVGFIFLNTPVPAIIWHV